jgi:ferredoxin
MTRYFASLIQEGFISRGIECDCCSIEEIADIPALWQKNPLALNYTIRVEKRRPLCKSSRLYTSVDEAMQSRAEAPELEHFKEEWASYDLIGFGSPVYEYRPAAVMIRFMLDLPDFGGKREAFSFATHDGAQGDYASFMERLLERKGFVYRGHLDHTFVNSAVLVMRRRYDTARSGRALARKSAHAEKKIHRFLDQLNAVSAKDISRETASKPGLLVSFAALPWRFMFMLGMEYLLYKFFFGYGLEHGGCIQCYTCIKQCPQGLIEKDRRGYPRRNHHCMYCLRCLNWCPTGVLYFSAITRGKTRFPGPDALLDSAREHHPERWLKK